jgi:hypothetical protein
MLLLVVAIPVLLVLWYMRRPMGSGGVSRDIFAMKAKSGMRRTFGVEPGDSFDKLSRDDAADLPESRDAAEGATLGIRVAAGPERGTWWKALVAATIVVGIPVALYLVSAAHSYTGQVTLESAGGLQQVRLATTGNVLNLGDADITVNGGEAILPNPVPAFLKSCQARVSWTPYIWEQAGASGAVVTLDLRP